MKLTRDKTVKGGAQPRMSGIRIKKIALWVKKAHLALALLFLSGALATFVLLPTSWVGLVIHLLFVGFVLLSLHSDFFFQGGLWKCKGGLLGGAIGVTISFAVSYVVWGPEDWHGFLPRVLCWIFGAIGVYLGYIVLDRNIDS